MKTLLLHVSLLLAASITCLGQTKPAPAPACTAAEFRQFDFWLGRWNVHNPDGTIIGSSEITRQSEGCAIREDWTARGGKHGMSINYFDPAAKRWHQDWVGGDGTILHLRGAVDGKAMVLTDLPNDKSANRIVWTPLSDKELKQEWSTSSDGGKTWQVSFVGIYERL